MPQTCVWVPDRVVCFPPEAISMIIGLSGVLACVIAHQEPSPEMDRRVRAIVGEVRGKTFLFARNLKTGSS
ncbi:MAG: hypothetical protein ACOYNP_08060, partial [Gemmataceae bacterium]